MHACPQFNFPPTKNSLREKFPPPSRLDVGRPGLSDAGFDLLSRLLALDPARRIKAEDALAHAWCGSASHRCSCSLHVLFRSVCIFLH